MHGTRAADTQQALDWQQQVRIFMHRALRKVP